MSLQAQLAGIRDKRTQTFALAENIRKKYEGQTEKSMTPDEVAQFNRAMDDAENFLEMENAIVRSIKFEQSSKESVNEISVQERSTSNSNDIDLQSSIFEKCLLKRMEGVVDFSKSDRVLEFTEEETNYLKRDQSLGDPTKGGFIGAPQIFVNSLIKDIDNEVYMRQLATVLPCKDGTSLGVPSLDTDLGDADWTGEITTTTPDDVTLGKRELNPSYISKEVKISEPLIRKSVMSITDLIRQRLAYKFSVTQEKGFITGDGVNKALGVNTADPNGVSTSRDYTGSTSLVISPGDIIGMYFFLKSGYSAKGTWLASRDAFSDIRQLKDSAGNYLWQPFDMPGRQLVGGNPGTIMGRPYLISEYCKFKTSSAWVAGDYAVTFGDFSYYYVADSLEMTMKVLNELYARTNQVGILGRMEVDGQPVLENAFVRLKIKA